MLQVPLEQLWDRLAENRRRRIEQALARMIARRLIPLTGKEGADE